MERIEGNADWCEGCYKTPPKPCLMRIHGPAGSLERFSKHNESPIVEVITFSNLIYNQLNSDISLQGSREDLICTEWAGVQIQSLRIPPTLLSVRERPKHATGVD